MDAVRWLKVEWDRILGFASLITGGLLIVLGYLGVSDAIHTPEALSYVVSGGIGGLFLLGVGATLLLSADLHDEWRKLDRLEDAMRSLKGEVVGSGDDPGEPLDLRGEGEATTRRLETQPSPAVRGSMSMMVTHPGTGAAVATIDLARRGRAFAAAGMAVGLVPIIVGWNQAAMRHGNQNATDAVTLAVAGLIVTGLVAAAVGLWMLRAMRVRARGVLAPAVAFVEWAGSGKRRRSEQGASRPLLSGGRSVLVAAGLTRYHAPGCPAVQGLAAREIDRDDVPPTIRPCRLCLGD
jgi:hypothetical protein